MKCININGGTGSPSPLASSLELVTDEVLTTMIGSHKGIEMHD